MAGWKESVCRGEGGSSCYEVMRECYIVLNRGGGWGFMHDNE